MRVSFIFVLLFLFSYLNASIFFIEYDYTYQKLFFDTNKNIFKHIKRVGKRCAIFKYLGGEIKTPQEVSRAGPKGE